MKLLRHSERRVPAILDAAIRVSGSLGDYRILNNLERIMLQVPNDTVPQSEVSYMLPSRVGAAAAAGRILEQDRQSAPGHEHEGDGGLNPEGKALAIAALKLAACPGEPTELRVAAIEALGIARDSSAGDFLDLIAADPQALDESRTLLLQALSLRSLTNVFQNNHLEESDVDERLRELTAAIQTQEGSEP